MIYIAPICHRRIGGARWRRLVRVFSVCDVELFGL